MNTLYQQATCEQLLQDSFFGDLHIQGTVSILFYTQVKTITTRWFESAEESHHDPVRKTQRV